MERAYAYRSYYLEGKARLSHAFLYPLSHVSASQGYEVYSGYFMYKVVRSRDVVFRYVKGPHLWLLFVVTYSYQIIQEARMGSVYLCVFVQR